jgi:hypothetical protein
MNHIIDDSRAFSVSLHPFQSTTFREIMTWGTFCSVSNSPYLLTIRLGISSSFSIDARSRFVSHFGPLNHQMNLGNHTLVFIDTPHLVEEDYERSGDRPASPFDKWTPIHGGTVEYVKTFGAGVFRLGIHLCLH